MSASRRTVILLSALLAIALLLAWRWQPRALPGGRMGLTLAIPSQLSAGTVFVARTQGYFARQELDVSVQSFTLGKQALQAVLDDQADLALVADVPFMLASQRGAPIAVVATVFASRHTMALLGRRDRGIGGAADLSGKTVGTVKGTNAQYFLDLLLDAQRIPGTAIQIVDLAPAQMSTALSSGQVDAITAWNPLLAKLQLEQGANAILMGAPDLFVYRFLLVGKRSYLAAHPQAVQRTLAALAAAVGFIQARPAQAQALIAAAIGLAPQQLAAAFRASDYALSLDQALLLSLDDQTRWAIRRGIIDAAARPNYLDAVDATPLSAVQPAAVSIIE